VLIVDDHPGVRSAIEALIARTPGLRVVGSASSGAAAVEGAARLRPAVVVMDLSMPGMNGVEATREICKDKAAPAVVAFSGSRELWREARTAGAGYTILRAFVYRDCMSGSSRVLPCPLHDAAAPVLISIGPWSDRPVADGVGVARETGIQGTAVPGVIELETLSPQPTHLLK
jgi:CheY-like chemotaxis protein